MTDNELLKLAAKAIGIEVVEYTWDKGAPWGEHQGFTVAGEGPGEWNPLVDDGARYRLAKALDIRIHFGPQYVTYVNKNVCGVISWPENAKDDAYAIVIAAANIGEAM